MKKSTRLLARKTRLLEAELKMLQGYVSEASFLLKDYSVEYAKDMSTILDFAKKTRGTSTSNEEDDQPAGEILELDPDAKDQSWQKTEDGWERIRVDQSLEEEVVASKAPPWAKKLYKKIAMASHPDITSKDTQSEKLKNIFLNSAEAMGSGDFNALLGLALELDIKIAEGDIDVIPLLQDKIKSLKEEKKVIETSPAWLWGEGFGIPQMRTTLAGMHLRNAGYDLKNEEIKSIIDKIEES